MAKTNSSSHSLVHATFCIERTYPVASAQVFRALTDPMAKAKWHTGGKGYTVLALYAHPFAAYCWKVLIALYENATPFTYRVVEDMAELESLWPIKKFPLLRDGDATIVESSINIEYLMRRYPGTTRTIPFTPSSASMIRMRAPSPIGSGKSLRPK